LSPYITRRKGFFDHGQMDGRARRVSSRAIKMHPAANINNNKITSTINEMINQPAV